MRNEAKKTKMIHSKVDMSTIILIPAHNEEKGVTETLKKLQVEITGNDHIVVVADNCCDKTAEISRRAGADVIERVAPNLIGKGYALNFGIEYIRSKYDYDVIVILDADCFFEHGSLSILSQAAYLKQSPIQATNISLPPEGKKIKISHKVAQFAWLIKNKIRPLGLTFLKLPVMLTGTGMAFPKAVVLEMEFDNGHIAEDMLLGINLAKKSIFALFSSDANVYSYFPNDIEAENKQKTRWVHGHMSIIFERVPSLLCSAIWKRSMKLMMLAIDLSVLPLVMLTTISVSSLFIVLGLSLINEQFYPLFMFMIMAIIVFIISILSSWWFYARDVLTANELCMIPVVVFTKISIYLSFFYKRQKRWLRTSRDTKE